MHISWDAFVQPLFVFSEPLIEIFLFGLPIVEFVANYLCTEWLMPGSKLTLRKPDCKPIYRREKVNKLFAGSGSVRIVKNCDFGLENAALGLRPRATFSRPRSHFFPIRTSQPANNIYIWAVGSVLSAYSNKPFAARPSCGPFFIEFELWTIS